MSDARQAPELDTVTLEVVDPNGRPKAEGLRLDTWKSYSFNQHFTTPADGWSLTLGDESISDELLAALVPWQRVKLLVNGFPQCQGLIDQVEISTSRDSGTELRLEGRNNLSPACDACMDPRTQFQPTQTLDQILVAIFGPFGFTVFTEDPDGNRTLKTGAIRGVAASKKGKPLKNFVVHQLKPYPHELTMQFASRIVNRFGLYLWAGVDGKTLIAAKPSFEQDTLQRLLHKRGLGNVYNNIKSATATTNAGEQPSVIIATGYGTGGENPRQSLALGIENPFIKADNSAVKARYPNIRFLQSNFQPFDVFSVLSRVTNYAARPLFLHDDESKTEKQLECFLRRELAVRMRKSFTYKCVVEGHTQSGTPWEIDTVVDVDDDVSNVHEPLWVMGKTFTKDRHSGTQTHLELVRRGSFDLGTTDQTAS